MDRKEVRLYEFFFNHWDQPNPLTMIIFPRYYLATTPQNTQEYLH
nr:MAG TPA: hypothetical protein [Caudoviricetes sp.]